MEMGKGPDKEAGKLIREKGSPSILPFSQASLGHLELSYPKRQRTVGLKTMLSNFQSLT